MEWVANVSEFPIPEPCTFTREERRLLHELQRRKHISGYEAKTQRHELDPSEREFLNMLEERQRRGEVIRYGALEWRFAPGEVVEVNDGVGRQLVARGLGKLRLLKWEEVRSLDVQPRTAHVETPLENAQLLAMTGADDDTVNPHAPTDIEMKDGLMRYGDGNWMPISAHVGEA